MLFLRLVLTAALLLTQLLAAGRVDLIRLHEGYWEELPFGAISTRRVLPLPLVDAVSMLVGSGCVPAGRSTAEPSDTG
ncbi:hypothetical protein [Streptomyces sp. NPDC059909]|uniref:hypothetical protein n=1 Tax=Streptomyces sp. NPDC059909 TaxID=3346998 RepID=UPI003655C1E5